MTPKLTATPRTTDAEKDDDAGSCSPPEGGKATGCTLPGEPLCKGSSEVGAGLAVGKTIKSLSNEPSGRTHLQISYVYPIMFSSHHSSLIIREACHFWQFCLYSSPPYTSVTTPSGSPMMFCVPGPQMLQFRAVIVVSDSETRVARVFHMVVE